MSRRPTANILLAWFIYLAMFENNNATSLRQPAMCCRWWLITISGIVRHPENVNYRCQYSAQSFSIWSITSVLHRRTVSVSTYWCDLKKPEILRFLELRQIAPNFNDKFRIFDDDELCIRLTIITHMIATTIDYQKLQDWHPKCLYCHFRLSVVVAFTRGQFLRTQRGQKPQICL